MTVNRRFLYWGVLFVAFGGVIVAADADLVSESTILNALAFWPLILIAVGVAILVRRSRYSLGAWLIAAALPGLAVGGALAAAPRFAIDCLDADRPILTTEAGELTTPATVAIGAACGSLRIDTAEGHAWQLVAGDDRATATVDAVGSRLSIDAGNNGGWAAELGRSPTWLLTLPTSAMTNLELNLNAGESTVDLDGAVIGALRLDTNAGSTTIDATGATLEVVDASVDLGSMSIALPSGDLTGSLDVNLGELKVCVPRDVGLRVTQGDDLGDVRYNGLEQHRGAWQSPDYEQAAYHADLLVNVSLGSLEFNPIGGCK
ncbi:MAG TPA: hypothetical protein VF971_07270 [Candidatus Limnocylindrales bacterium]